MGCVTPIGIGRQAYWSALCKGESGVHPIESFDVSKSPLKIAAQVRDFDWPFAFRRAALNQRAQCPWRWKIPNETREADVFVALCNRLYPYDKFTDDGFAKVESISARSKKHSSRAARLGTPQH